MNRGIRAIVGLLIIFLLTAGVVFLLWRHNACTNEVLRTAEISGVRFDIERSYCDLFAKDESVSVYATTVRESTLRKALGWFRHGELLFRYDPGNDNNPLPTVTSPTQADIRIAVPLVSSVIVQRRKWDGKSVSYDIGKIYYPSSQR